MITRRHLLGTAGAGAALAVSGTLPKLSQAEAAGAELSPGVPPGIGSYVTMGTLPGKKPLIQLADKPPNYESPLEYFRTPITPNNEFFVRYHLADIPEVDVKTYKISVGGDGANGQAELTLDDLKKMPPVEVVAVNQCSGNRRGLSKPHVAGVEWGYGAMGCAHWKGARLKDVLDKVGLKKEAIEISFNGADGPAIDKTPDFIKSLPTWKAMDADTIIAYEMNGAPLPHFNGFPARLIVPGWTGTYWMKHLITINALTKPQGGFWMNPAYRIPVGKFPVSGPLHHAGIRRHHADHRDRGQFADHQPSRRRQGESRQGHGQRHGLGRRLRHPLGGSLDRRRQDLVERDARAGSRPLRVPAVELRSAGQARQEHGDGQRHQQDRPKPDRRVDLQSGRLSQQRHAKHHADSLRGGDHADIRTRFRRRTDRASRGGAEQQIALKKAPGVDKVEANCQACHSLAYIPMNSPFLNAAGWNAEVTKMIKAIRRADRRRRCQGHRRLSGEELRYLKAGTSPITRQFGPAALAGPSFLRIPGHNCVRFNLLLRTEASYTALQ